MNPRSEIANGWTVAFGAAYHFEHVALRRAKALRARCHELHVVETINWARAHGARGDVHLNRYFAVSLADAIGIAARIEVLAADIAENVVAIRPASDTECAGWRRALERFERDGRALADEAPAPRPTKPRPAGRRPTKPGRPKPAKPTRSAAARPIRVIGAPGGRKLPA